MSKPTISMTECAQCGMLTTPREYHPYGACVWFKRERQGDKVDSHMASIMDYAMRAHAAGLSVAEAMQDHTRVPSWEAIYAER